VTGDRGWSPPRPAEQIQAMPGYHSPQVDAAVRLNTNEASTPPLEELNRRVAEELASLAWNRYPDRSAAQLREAIARVESVTAGRALRGADVFVANGSNEVLQNLLLAYAGAGRRVVLFEPTYAMHSQIARTVGSEVRSGPRSEDLRLDPESAAATILEHRPSVTFVCSPNNPTGMVETPETIQAVLDAVRSVGGLLVIDEAYGQFSPWSALSLVDENQPLVVTRTFSKTWSMAGLRLGYAIAPSWAITELDKVVLPYHLDSLKQRVGTIALDFEEEMRARVAAVVEERGLVAVGLAELGCEQWPSGANFILFRPPTDPQQTWDRLLERGVLVRNCAGWPGTEGCLRVTIGTAEENRRFLEALAEVTGAP
jgi:histidinol-phosphate aminotransferase